MPICKFFASEGGCKRRNCPFSHDAEVNLIPALKSDEATIDPPSTNTKSCTFFAKGNCRNGDTCSFNHDIETVQAVTTSAAPTAQGPVKPCKFFLQGRCHYGISCRFLHKFETAGTPVAQDVARDSNELVFANLTRELFGTTTKFGDGGQVIKLSLPTDFSSVRLDGLPPNCETDLVMGLLAELGFEVEPECIKIAYQPDLIGLFSSADIKVEDPLFAASFCQKLKSSEGTLIQELNSTNSLSATPIQPTSRSTALHGVDCQKVLVSWYKPTRPAYLNFGIGEQAAREVRSFTQRTFEIQGQSFRGLRYCVDEISILKHLPEATSKEDIARAIGDYAPISIDLGPLNYVAKIQDVNSTVRYLLSSLGPLEYWDNRTNANLNSKRTKVKARFQYEADAREAVELFNGISLPVLGGGRLSVQLVKSAKFKVTTDIFDAVRTQIEAKNRDWAERQVHLSIHRNTDIAERFTILKIEGGTGENMAFVKNDLEKILDGHVAQDGDLILWSDTSQSRDELREIENIGVVIVCDRMKSRIRIYGTHERVEEAQNLISDMVKYEALVHPLIDPIEAPRTALTIGGHDSAEPNEGECVICLSAVEKSIRTSCNHLYDLGCFEDLCSAAGSNDREFCIFCEAAGCGKILTLMELQDHLSSKAFENLLEASLKSYLRHHPEDFHTCPTADCNQVCRMDSNIKIRTCSKCAMEICMDCHASHSGMTCTEFKYEASVEVFNAFKLENGIKDCPRCKTTIEKNGGCNHITCRGCSADICWVCLEIFEDGAECYAHMSAAHGGNGFEALNDIENWGLDPLGQAW